MKFIYDFFIILAYIICQPLRLISSKINLSYKGRMKSFEILKKEVNPNEKNIWFHVSSLGEFEIAMPIIESLKKKFDNIKIIVTFFSPSGYENSKKYKSADSKLYLPLDSSYNAKRFVNIVNPRIAIFIKNDIWSNYIYYLRENNSVIYSVSSKFNKSQFYFKFYGSWFLKQLKKIDFLYVQDDISKRILEKNSFKNVNISGDLRYTSVIKTLNKNKRIIKVEKFINDKMCFIAGSIWENDIKLIDKVIRSNIKSIIAPHDISGSLINNLKRKYAENCIKFSDLKNENDFKKKILIIDSIGILKYLYRYADIAYVGGGMGNKGLHNILEPGVFSIPILIGKNFKGFSEAEDLISSGGVISVNNSDEFYKCFNKLNDSEELRYKSGKSNLNYIIDNVEKNKNFTDSLTENLHHL